MHRSIDGLAFFSGRHPVRWKRPEPVNRRVAAWIREVVPDGKLKRRILATRGKGGTFSFTAVLAEGKIAAWVDQSGKNRHFVQPEPSLRPIFKPY